MLNSNGAALKGYEEALKDNEEVWEKWEAMKGSEESVKIGIASKSGKEASKVDEAELPDDWEAIKDDERHKRAMKRRKGQLGSAKGRHNN